MIRDPAVLKDIQEQWRALSKLVNWGRLYFSEDGIRTETGPDELANLPFVLAYALLDQILNQLITEGVFSCKEWQLGAKMKASKAALPWQSYDLVAEGRCRRNELAHQAKLQPKKECARYVAAVGAELRAWGIVT